MPWALGSGWGVLELLRVLGWQGLLGPGAWVGGWLELRLGREVGLKSPSDLDLGWSWRPGSAPASRGAGWGAPGERPGNARGAPGGAHKGTNLSL